ncbi:ribosomal protein S2 [Dendrothele bispora CBS 962.96]|uniref:Ribosomal protein S2 n=1 Tax=Dendrothele bispora (strain CBS 962.96) TaxID=1314807 RepID=A0A4V4HGM1_DENBC|nr:ribosomal protein S2 [Dendrothele bispora CBS 962.96]
MLRSCLTNSTRCRPSLSSFAQRRFASNDANRRLQDDNDWTEFQANRASFKSLVNGLSQYGSTQARGNTWKLRDSLHNPSRNATISALLASGAHFGHASTRMNPSFMPYAYGTRAGITIIDLDQTLPLLRRAASLVRAIAANDGQIVFIGTRPDLRPVVQKAAERLEEQGYHVGDRWLPGTLTNKWQMFGHDIVRKERVVPDLVVVLNPIANMNAIRECALEHVPTIGIVDSNVDPRVVMYPIPANDESTRTAEIIAGVLSIAGREGVMIRRAEERKRLEEEERRQGMEEREHFSKQQFELDKKADANAFDY